MMVSAEQQAAGTSYEGRGKQKGGDDPSTCSGCAVGVLYHAPTHQPSPMWRGSLLIPGFIYTNGNHEGCRYAYTFKDVNTAWSVPFWSIYPLYPKS